MSKIIFFKDQKEEKLEKYKMPLVSEIDYVFYDKQKNQSQSLNENYERGLADGRNLEKDLMAANLEKKIKELQDNNKLILEELSHLKKDLFVQAEKEVIELSLAIAKKIVGQEVEQRRDFALNMAKIAIKKIGEQAGKLIVKVNPADLSLFTEQTKELHNLNNGGKDIVVEVDETISRGGCIIETPSGDFNATIEEQFRYLTHELSKEQEKEKEG